MSAQGASIRNRHKAAIREENEKAILEAAEEVFAEYGFSGATTSRIAERAHSSPQKTLTGGPVFLYQRVKLCSDTQLEHS